MALFRHGLRFNLPLFPTADHYSLLLPPRPVAEPLSRAGGGPHGFLACTEMLAVVGSLPSEIWWASEAHLEEAPTMADTTPPEIYPRTRSSLCHRPVPSPVMATPDPVLRCGMEWWTEAFARFSLWSMVRWSWKHIATRADLSSLPQRLARPWTILTGVVQGFSHSSVWLSLLPSSQGAPSPLHRTQDWDIHFMAKPAPFPGQVSTCEFFFSSGSLPRGTGPDLITFLPFLPDSVCILLTVLVVQESFWQLPVSFQWELFHI